MNKLIIPFVLIALIVSACPAGNRNVTLMTGAERTGEYLPLIKGKRVAVVANQTSIVGKSHLVDTLISAGIDIRLIFAPEHGFRDLADAGAVITS